MADGSIFMAAGGRWRAGAAARSEGVLSRDGTARGTRVSSTGLFLCVELADAIVCAHAPHDKLSSNKSKMLDAGMRPEAEGCGSHEEHPTPQTGGAERSLLAVDSDFMFRVGVEDPPVDTMRL